MWRKIMDNYKFYSSFKHSFIYKRNDEYISISGDIYRDLFTAELSDEDIQYFYDEQGVEVCELVWEDGIIGGRLIVRYDRSYDE
jgi:hypothetical protein